jgi:hypothetical protein
LVTLVSDTGKLEYTPPIEKLMYSIGYFFGFLVLMRLDVVISGLVLLLILIIYFLELNKDFYLDRGSEINNSKDREIYENNKFWITFNWPYKVRLFPVNNYDFQIINRIETIIYYIIIFLLIIGFISYGGEIHDTIMKNKTLTWIKIITDTNVCKIKDRKSFWHYFNIGLGVKI